MDHIINNCSMYYHLWKYWHSEILHAKSMAIIKLYTMYVECTLVKLNPLWNIQKPMSFWQFWERLSIQKFQYDPQHRLYHGEEGLCKSTQKSKEYKAKGASLLESRGSKRGRGHPYKPATPLTVPIGVIADALVTVSTGMDGYVAIYPP
jgi:hypothetical protein